MWSPPCVIFHGHCGWVGTEGKIASKFSKAVLLSPSTDSKHAIPSLSEPITLYLSLECFSPPPCISVNFSWLRPALLLLQPLFPDFCAVCSLWACGPTALTAVTTHLEFLLSHFPFFLFCIEEMTWCGLAQFYYVSFCSQQDCSLRDFILFLSVYSYWLAWLTVNAC